MKRERSHGGGMIPASARPGIRSAVACAHHEASAASDVLYQISRTLDAHLDYDDAALRKAAKEAAEHLARSLCELPLLLLGEEPAELVARVFVRDFPF